MTHLIFYFEYLLKFSILQPYKTKIYLIFYQIRIFAHQENSILKQVSELSVQWSYACEIYFCPKMTHLIFYFEFLLIFGKIYRFAHEENTILKQVSGLWVQWSYASETYFCSKMTHLIFKLKHLIMVGILGPSKPKKHLICFQICRFVHKENAILK